MCQFGNYITDLIFKGELKPDGDGKYWTTHAHLDHFLYLTRKENVKLNLSKFGEYLKSEKRRELYKSHPEFGDKNLEKRLSEISHSDIENFMETYTE